MNCPRIASPPANPCPQVGSPQGCFGSSGLQEFWARALGARDSWWSGAPVDFEVTEYSDGACCWESPCVLNEGGRSTLLLQLLGAPLHKQCAKALTLLGPPWKGPQTPLCSEGNWSFRKSSSLFKAAQLERSRANRTSPASACAEAVRMEAGGG